MIGLVSAKDVFVDKKNAANYYANYKINGVSPGIIRFKVNAIVCNQDLSDLQKEVGYEPAKYGGPYDVYYRNGWTYWHCMSSCE